MLTYLATLGLSGGLWDLVPPLGFESHHPALGAEVLATAPLGKCL